MIITTSNAIVVSLEGMWGEGGWGCNGCGRRASLPRSPHGSLGHARAAAGDYKPSAMSWPSAAPHTLAISRLHAVIVEQQEVWLQRVTTNTKPERYLFCCIEKVYFTIANFAAQDSNFTLRWRLRNYIFIMSACHGTMLPRKKKWYMKTIDT